MAGTQGLTALRAHSTKQAHPPGTPGITSGAAKAPQHQVCHPPGTQWITSGAAKAPICWRTTCDSSFFKASLGSTPLAGRT